MFEIEELAVDVLDEDWDNELRFGCVNGGEVVGGAPEIGRMLSGGWMTNTNSVTEQGVLTITIPEPRSSSSTPNHG